MSKVWNIEPVTPKRLMNERLNSYVHGQQVNQTGWYNMKLFQYENGTCEIRTYSDVMGRKPCSMSEELVAIKAQVAKIHNQLKTHCMYNPFAEQEQGMFDLDEMEEDARRKAHSAYNSYSRTIQQIYSCSRQCQWEWFVTLTYASEKADRYSYVDTMKKARQWFNNQRKRYAPDLQYLFVGEGHKDGAFHVHGLLAQCGNMKFADSGHTHKSGHKTYNVAGWNYGFSHAQRVDDVSKISSYITKYITKSLVAETGGLRRYYKSNNIPDVETSEFMVDGDSKEAFAEMLVDSLGVVQMYSKEIDGYTAVKYQYFKSEVTGNAERKCNVDDSV